MPRIVSTIPAALNVGTQIVVHGQIVCFLDEHFVSRGLRIAVFIELPLHVARPTLPVAPRPKATFPPLMKFSAPINCAPRRHQFRITHQFNLMFTGVVALPSHFGFHQDPLSVFHFFASRSARMHSSSCKAQCLYFFFPEVFRLRVPNSWVRADEGQCWDGRPQIRPNDAGTRRRRRRRRRRKMFPRSFLYSFGYLNSYCREVQPDQKTRRRRRRRNMFLAYFWVSALNLFSTTSSE